MNSNAEIAIDTSKLRYFFDHMSKKDLDKAERDALRTSLKYIRNQANRNIRSRFPKAYSTKGGKRIQQGLISGVNKSNQGQWYGQIHIMGSGSSGSRGYILKFFELGTKQRYRNKSISTGSIKALYFFRDAVASKKKETFESMESNMQAAVIKQWNKAAQK